MTTIMVVDDEKNIVGIAGLLLKNEGFGVRGAYGGKECFGSVEQARPGISGWERVRRLKLDPYVLDHKGPYLF